MSFSEGDYTSSLGRPPGVQRTFDRGVSSPMHDPPRDVVSELLRTRLHNYWRRSCPENDH
jgi:hypothetical protein